MIKAYLINLDVDTDRREMMLKRFGELEVEVERFPAIDGRQMTEAEYQLFTTERPEAPWGRGQAGCFLSHFGVWEKVANSDSELAAIFEDDLIVSDDVAALLSDVSWLPPDYDIVRLETSTNRVLLSNPVQTIGRRKIHRVSSTSWCAGAYIISRAAARRLLEVPKRLHDSVDAFLFAYEKTPIASSLRIYQVVPACCVQGKFTASADPAFVSRIENPRDQGNAAIRTWLGRPSFMPAWRMIRGYRRIDFQG